MNERAEACLYLSLAMIIAGSAVVVGKMTVTVLPVFLAVELGIGVGLLFLLPLTFLIRRETPVFDARTNLVLLAQALCGIVLYRAFIFWGLCSTSAAAGGLISSAAPVVIVAGAFLVFGESLSGRRVAGVLCVVAGLLAVNLQPLLASSSENAGTLFGSVVGNGLIFIAVMCESAFSILSKAPCKPMTALYRTTVVTSYAFVCLLPLAVHDAADFDMRNIDADIVACVAYYGFFVSFLSYVFWFKGIARVPAGIAAAFTGLVPPSGIVLSWHILHEPVSAVHIVGLICILAGIALSCLPERTGRVATSK